MELTAIIAGIQAALAAAPGIINVATKAKDFITALFEAKVIDLATQQRVHDFVDQTFTAFDSGKTPPSWTVEPNPA